VVQFASAIGLPEPFQPQLSLALGTGEVTPLELTSAYSTFPNHGIRQDPYAIEEVEDPYGNIVEQHTPKPHEVLTEQQSYLMVSLMRSVVDHGTGYPARGKYGFTAPAGGKTGTTDDYTDAWFVGYIPRLACGVWVGFDEKKSIGARMTGAAAALPAWAAFMNTAVGVYGSEDFEPPDGIVSVTTCEKSGMLANSGCPHPVADAYLAGTEPTQHCTLHSGGALAPSAPVEAPEEDIEEAPSPTP
jgi:penicillin-binding protein 1A